MHFFITHHHTSVATSSSHPNSHKPSSRIETSTVLVPTSPSVHPGEAERVRSSTTTTTTTRRKSVLRRSTQGNTQGGSGGNTRTNTKTEYCLYWYFGVVQGAWPGGGGARGKERENGRVRTGRRGGEEEMSAELQPPLRVDPKALLQRLQQCVSTTTWQQYCALLNGFVNGKVSR